MNVPAGLAPCVVVRAALFPLGRLHHLADAGLAAQAARVGTVSDAGEREEAQRAYEAAYQDAMRRQQSELAAATLEDPAFMKALCFGNDALSRRIAAFGRFPERRNKRARQVEGTLYRHLARASWRTEPCDLWAGTSLARFGPRPTRRAVALRVAVAPDLRPYQALVQALAGHADYIARGRYKLNPTLRLDPVGGRWHFSVRVATSVVHDARPCSPGLDAILGRLATMAPLTLREIAARIGGDEGPADPSLDAMLQALVTVGLVVGGLSFPRRYASSWDALAQVARRLDAPHALAWCSALRRMRRLCRRIEQDLPRMTPADLHFAMDEARRIIVGLAQALHLDPPAFPRSVLRCDSSLPFSIEFGPEDRDRMARAVEAYDAFERRHGVDTAARACHRSRLLKDGETPPTAPGASAAVPTQEDAWRDAGSDPILGERLLRWSTWLSSGSDEVVVGAESGPSALELAPLGGLMVRWGDGRLRIVGMTTEIGACYARYGLLEHGLGRRARHRLEGHPLHAWHLGALQRAADEAGIDLVEYTGPAEGMPNALARPDFGIPGWDRWDLATRYGDDQAATVMRTVGDTTVALVQWPGRSRPSALFCFAPVDLGYSEPTLERLLLSSFRELPTWLSAQRPLACELARETPTPRLVVPSGDIARPRRVVVHGPALARLRACGRAERFQRWQALARAHDWTPIVLVGRDGEPLLPVVRDSPLAVEAALQGLGEGVRFLCIEELDDPAAATDDPSALAFEVIVPHLRHRHAWNGLDSA